MTRVADLMTRDVETLGAEASLHHAAERMRAANVGSLPVCQDSRVVGLVTDRDITVRAVAEGRDPYQTRVRDIMTADIVSCRTDQDVSEALQLMVDHQVRRLPVVELDGRLVGYLTLATVARKEGDEKMLARVLKGVARRA